LRPDLPREFSKSYFRAVPDKKKVGHRGEGKISGKAFFYSLAAVGTLAQTFHRQAALAAMRMFLSAIVERR